MLTKDDLKAIEKLIKPLDEKISDLQEDLKDYKADTNLAIFTLRAEFFEESKNIKRRLSELKETLDAFIKHFDSHLQDTRIKVDRIEDHLKLPPIS